MLSGAEWSAAVALVEEPLAAVGYSMKRDITVRILSHANSYPSLIQLFCRELLNHLGARRRGLAGRRAPLPVNIGPSDVDDAFRSAELRERIRQSFDLTLNLDPRYRVIALSLAWILAQKRGIDTVLGTAYASVSELRSAVLEVWPGGFSEDPSQDTFRALLDEMVGLGVLRENEGRYAMRGANVPLLLGDEESVFRQLASLDRPETFASYDAESYRRPLRSSARGTAQQRALVAVDAPERRSPLSASQEYELSAPGNGVSIVCGTLAGGLAEVVEGVETIDGLYPVILETGSTLESLRSTISGLIKKAPMGTTLVVLPVEVPWVESWIHAAYELVRRRTSKERGIRVAFLADPSRVWALLRDRGGTSVATRALQDLGVTVQSLRPWREAAVRQWADDLRLPTAAGAFAISNVLARTGNWPSLLAAYLGAARQRSSRASDPGGDFLSVILRRDGLTRVLRTFGLDETEPVRILKQLQRLRLELNEPITLETIVTLGDNVSSDLAEHSLAWAEALSLVESVPCGSGERSWTIDPIVSVLLAESASVTSLSPNTEAVE
jgi:hypothetical protein